MADISKDQQQSSNLEEAGAVQSNQVPSTPEKSSPVRTRPTKTITRPAKYKDFVMNIK